MDVGGATGLVGGATASLSDVTIRPPAETAEDRLAKKLSSYLTDSTVELPGSGSSATTSGITTRYPAALDADTSVQNTQLASDKESLRLSKSDLLPSEKVSESFGNHDIRREVVEEGSNGAESNMGLLESGSYSIQGSNSVGISESEKVNLESDMVIATECSGATCAEAAAGKDIAECADTEIPPIQQGISASEDNNRDIVTNGATSADASKRNALDSVGFLSCQNGMNQKVRNSSQTIPSLGDGAGVRENVNLVNTPEPTDSNTDNSPNGLPEKVVQESIFAPASGLQNDSSHLSINGSGVSHIHTYEQTASNASTVSGFGDDSRLGNEDLEFQDLMNSMSLPDMSTHTISSGLTSEASSGPGISLPSEFNSLPALPVKETSQATSLHRSDDSFTPQSPPSLVTSPDSCSE